MGNNRWLPCSPQLIFCEVLHFGPKWCCNENNHNRNLLTVQTKALSPHLCSPYKFKDFFPVSCHSSYILQNTCVLLSFTEVKVKLHKWGQSCLKAKNVIISKNTDCPRPPFCLLLLFSPSLPHLKCTDLVWFLFFQVFPGD